MHHFKRHLQQLPHLKKNINCYSLFLSKSIPHSKWECEALTNTVENYSSNVFIECIYF